MTSCLESDWLLFSLSKEGILCSALPLPPLRSVLRVNVPVPSVRRQGRQLEKQSPRGQYYCLWRTPAPCSTLRALHSSPRAARLDPLRRIPHLQFYRGD